MGGCTGSSSLSGLVIGVLSVSCSSELLLSFSAPRSTSTPLLMRTTSSPMTHGQHTVLLAHPTLYLACSLHGIIMYYSVRACVYGCAPWFHLVSFISEKLNRCKT